jgi:hypothetical protein
MQLHEHEGAKTLMMANDEIFSVEAGAAAVAALTAGQGLTTQKLALYMKEPKKLCVTHGAAEYEFDKTAQQTVDTIRSYRTPERILAALAM